MIDAEPSNTHHNLQLMIMFCGRYRNAAAVSHDGSKEQQ
jgi:hypothetical protein